MGKDEIEAQLIMAKLRQERNLIEEFESLRPNWKGSVIRAVSSLASIAFIMWLFPEISEQPVLYVLLLISVMTGQEIYHESKKTNKRIDALYRLLKHDV
jgi:hypothetical protein